MILLNVVHRCVISAAEPGRCGVGRGALFPKTIGSIIWQTKHC